MRKRFLVLLACATVWCHGLRAQVAPSAVGGERRLWVGGEYSNFNPDWGLVRLPGIGIYADLGLFRRYGLEGEARFLDFTKPGGLTEKSYLIGPYATLYRRGKLTANVKFVAGAGLVNYSGGIGYGSYLEYVPGVNVEYRFAHKLKARFDYEYQLMPSAPGLPGIPDNGINPNGFSGGVSYRVF
jgi:hypothetical protein